MGRGACLVSRGGCSRYRANHVQELGVLQTLASMNEINEKNKALKAVPRRRQTARVVSVVRRSDRIQNNPAPVSLSEESMFKSLGFVVPRAPVSGTRGSNLGVRRQGGRIYDSENGVTCHWCRQKTLEDHVVCTSEDCSGGSKLPVSFCRMCLWNRHGENVYDAIASGKWVCPRCRGGCGEGCTSCCNCGPCRKKNGLAPTHQMVKLARASGFDNVHDYLIHTKTGEPASKIAKRKLAFDWGQWLLEEEDVDIMGGTEAEEENKEENVSPSVASPAARMRARRLRGSADGGDEDDGDGVEQGNMNDKSGRATGLSPSKKAKLDDKRTERTKLAKMAKTRKTPGLATTKLAVQAVNTPAKSTPMATRRNTRSSVARGLAM